MPAASSKDQLTAAYVSGLGLSVISLSQPFGDPDCIAVDMAPWPGRRAHDNARLLAAFAFAKSSHAELVMSLCTSDPEAITGGAKAIAKFHAAVAAVGATWRAVDEILALAEADIDELERQLKAWNQSGGLQSFNRAYKSYRKQCLATRAPAMAYSAYLHRFKLRLAEMAGRNVAAGQTPFAGMEDILHATSGK